jgi:hypothetical protein
VEVVVLEVLVDHHIYKVLPVQFMPMVVVLAHGVDLVVLVDLAEVVQVMPDTETLISNMVAVVHNKVLVEHKLGVMQAELHISLMVVMEQTLRQLVVAVAQVLPADLGDIQVEVLDFIWMNFMIMREMADILLAEAVVAHTDQH